jgi:hypothetical protein
MFGWYLNRPPLVVGNGKDFSLVWGYHITPLLGSLLTNELLGLAIATLTIFIRSIFRVAELNGGFSSDLANDEVAFMILEGAMMVIACGCLSAFHPGYCLSGQWTNPTSLSFGPGESEVVLATMSDSDNTRAGGPATI